MLMETRAAWQRHPCMQCEAVIDVIDAAVVKAAAPSMRHAARESMRHDLTSRLGAGPDRLIKPVRIVP